MAWQPYVDRIAGTEHVDLAAILTRADGALVAGSPGFAVRAGAVGRGVEDPVLTATALRASLPQRRARASPRWVRMRGARQVWATGTGPRADRLACAQGIADDYSFPDGISFAGKKFAVIRSIPLADTHSSVLTMKARGGGAGAGAGGAARSPEANAAPRRRSLRGPAQKKESDDERAVGLILTTTNTLVLVAHYDAADRSCTSVVNDALSGLADYLVGSGM